MLTHLKAWEDEEFAIKRLGLDAPLGSIDRSRLNVNGSSLAAGHPSPRPVGESSPRWPSSPGEARGDREALSAASCPSALPVGRVSSRSWRPEAWLISSPPSSPHRWRSGPSATADAAAPPRRATRSSRGRCSSSAGPLREVPARAPRLGRRPGGERRRGHAGPPRGHHRRPVRCRGPGRARAARTIGRGQAAREERPRRRHRHGPDDADGRHGGDDNVLSKASAALARSCASVRRAISCSPKARRTTAVWSAVEFLLSGIGLRRRAGRASRRDHGHERRLREAARGKGRGRHGGRQRHRCRDRQGARPRRRHRRRRRPRSRRGARQGGQRGEGHGRPARCHGGRRRHAHRRACEAAPWRHRHRHPQCRDHAGQALRQPGRGQVGQRHRRQPALHPADERGDSRRGRPRAGWSHRLPVVHRRHRGQPGSDQLRGEQGGRHRARHGARGSGEGPGHHRQRGGTRLHRDRDDGQVPSRLARWGAESTSLQQVVAPGRGGDDRVAQPAGRGRCDGARWSGCGQSWLGA